MIKALPRWIVCPDGNVFQSAALDIFLDLYRQALASNGTFTVVLSGGKSPEGVYSGLANPAFRSELDWKKVHLFWGDERFVHSNHPESNFGAVNKILISKINIPFSNVHPIRIEGLTPQEAAKKYEEDLKVFFKVKEGSFPRFDLIFLGIGEDGHAASLFPGIPELKEKKRWVISPYIEKLKSYRITMTLPILNQGKNILVLATGEKKAEVLKMISKPEGTTLLPIQLIDPVSGNLTFLVDQEAASRL